MNNKLRQVLVRIGAFAAALAVVLIPAAYYFCLFDFTFTRRPASWPQSPDYIVSLITGKRTAEPTTADATKTAGETADVTATADVTEEKPEPSPTAAELIAEGYRPSDREFDASVMRLAKTGCRITPDARLSISKKTADVLTYEKDREDGLPYAVYTAAETDRLTVEVYMGYALIDSGKDIAVCALTDGGALTELARFAPDEYEPAFTRDRDGRPLFRTCGTDAEAEYFYIDGGRMVKSDYDDETDNRALYFDYPAYYGIDGYTDGIRFVFQTVAYRGDPAMPIEACSLYDEAGFIPYSSLTEYYNADGRYLISSMRAPVSFGEESIGSFFLDHGCMMARIVTIDWYTFTLGYEKVFSDETAVIDRYGKRLEIPYAYTVKAYSSGLALLEKDGRYGYMDTTGAWVVQPSLIYAEPFYSGLASVGYEDGSRALIAADGSEIIPGGKYDYISHSSSGLIAAHSADGWDFYTVMDKSEGD